MNCRDDDTAAQALHELARWIDRDGIDSDHLDAYMRELLSARLLELPASCRLEATVVVKCLAGLPAREVASRLHERAHRLEQTILRPLPSTPKRPRPRFEPDPSDYTPDRADEDLSPGARNSARHSSSVPELIGSVVFTVLAAATLFGCPTLLPSHPMIGGDDERLRFTVAATCGLVGALYAYEAACQTWRNSRPR